MGCVWGNLVYDYIDPAAPANRVVKPSANVEVQAWDIDTASDNEYLGGSQTDGSGSFRLCFAQNDEEGGVRQDVRLAFVTRNPVWQLTQPDDARSLFVFWSAEIFPEVVDGEDLGEFAPGDPWNTALQLFDTANDVYNWKPGGPGCWEDSDTVCRRMQIVWSPDTPFATEYWPAENEVHIDRLNATSRIIVAHEMGHAIMDDVFDDDISTSCVDHVISSSHSDTCAWSEGFATWIALRTFGTSVYSDPVGSFTVDIESPTWSSPLWWDNGDTVEGRVTGALLDIADTANEGGDQFAEGDAKIWHTLQHHVSHTFVEFWAHRKSDGFDVSSSEVLSTQYHNTIDYSFQPLTPSVPVTESTPFAPNTYSVNTTRTGWSVVAARPPSLADYDLSVHDDLSLRTHLGTSGITGSGADFVAIDSGRRPLGDYYPRVSARSGVGSYQVGFEEASTSYLVANVSRSFTMGTGRIAAVWNTTATAGARMTLTLTPGNTSQEGDIYVMCSTSSPSTWVRSRSVATAKANGGGAGAVETVSFTPTTSGTCGVVIINEAGSGNYTLRRT